MRALAIALLLGSPIFPAGGQTPVVVPPADITAKSAAYQKAFNAWRRGDPTLEKDLIKQPPEQVLKRIADDEARASSLAMAEFAYYGAIMTELQRQITTVRSSFGAGAPSKKDRSEMTSTVKEQLSALAEQDRSLER